MKGSVLIMAVMIFITAHGQIVQKPAVDSLAIRSWEKPALRSISPDGNYFIYQVHERKDEKVQVTVQSADSSFKMNFAADCSLRFTSDSKNLVIKNGDSIYVLGLTGGQKRWIGNAGIYILMADKKEDWIVYQPKGSSILTALGISTNKRRELKDVTSFLQYDQKNIIVYSKKQGSDAAAQIQYGTWDPIRVEEKTLCSVGAQVTGITYDDHNGGQCLFISEDGKTTVRKLYYYRVGMKTPLELSYNPYGDTSLKLSGQIVFSESGDRVFYELTRFSSATTFKNPAKLTIWSYQNARLQMPVTAGSNQPTIDEASYFATISLKDFQPLIIESGGRRFNGFHNLSGLRGNANYCLVSSETQPDNYWWREQSANSLYLFSLKDGTVRSLVENSHNIIPYLSTQISPLEKFVIYYDPSQHEYFSYEIATGVSRDITKEGKVSWSRDINNRYGDPQSVPVVGIAGWLPSDKALLIYDRFDIWQVDPLAKRPPVCLTSGYGRVNAIQFKVMIEDGEKDLSHKVYSEEEKLSLSAFDTITKQSGFYCIQLGKKGNPQLLSMAPFLYSDVRKASGAYRWIVTRESASEFPNLYYTTNFKTFIPVTDKQPQRKYNWLTSERVTWPLGNGKSCQGILYKPEDFDSTKKYPVIFHYYELRSDELHEMLQPEYGWDNINIPWFVSRGYIVFVPDMHFEKSDVPFQSSVNTVVAAAKYLGRFPWIDKSRMGLMGHSHGGSQTSFIITQTHLFAAAVEAAGSVDEISYYGLPFRDGRSRYEVPEIGQHRLGGTLWEKPDWYIKNSAIFYANNVTTPLLIMHNREDDNVPFNQGAAFFMALRRLGKRAWMLQYDGMEHSLLSPDLAPRIDYTTKMLEFFDHYLKGAPVPIWMGQAEPQEQAVWYGGKMQKVNEVVKDKTKEIKIQLY